MLKRRERVNNRHQYQKKQHEDNKLEVGIHTADNKHSRGAAVERQPAGPQNLLRKMEEASGSGQVVACARRVAREGAEGVGTSACNACRCMAK